MLYCKPSVHRKESNEQVPEIAFGYHGLFQIRKVRQKEKTPRNLGRDLLPKHGYATPKVPTALPGNSQCLQQLCHS